MLVSPRDSLAAITNNVDLIKSLTRIGPLNGVSRSMPNSGAIDRVAKKKGLQ
jgi:phosphoglucomutase